MKRIYIDLDDTIVAYTKHAKEICANIGQDYDECKAKDGHKPWLVPGFFSELEFMPGAKEALEFLFSNFDVYILSASPWSCPWAATEKVQWVKDNIPQAYKRLILSHHKELCAGDYLIDDLMKNGASEFTGEHIHFGHGNFQTWDDVVKYFENELK